MAHALHQRAHVPQWTQCLSICVLASSLACNAPLQPERLQPPPRAATHVVEIREPTKLTTIAVKRSDANAKSLQLGCPACHSLRERASLPASPAELDEFHVGLVFTHGELACASCHVSGRTDALHLAPGQALRMQDALQLCAQCHGPQWRDFQHGAHGGMTGHWDLSRGPRTRNHCVDCHDPHAPKFVGGQPVLPPRDRFLEMESHE